MTVSFRDPGMSMVDLHADGRVDVWMHKPACTPPTSAAVLTRLPSVSLAKLRVRLSCLCVFSQKPVGTGIGATCVLRAADESRLKLTTYQCL